jgi:hypothetical protein
MSYDSEETKKKADLNAERMKRIYEVFGNKDTMEKVQNYIEQLTPIITDVHQKSKLGIKLTDEEAKLLNEHLPVILKLRDFFTDAQIILDDNLFVEANAFFFHIHKLAEQGDEKAKKLYEEMLPLYRKAHGLDGPEMNN